MKKLHTYFLVLLVLLSSVVSPVIANTLVEPVMPAATAPSEPEPDPAKLKAAMKEFRSLPRKERRERVKEAKKMYKEYRAEKRAGKAGDTDIVLLAILCVLLPPLAVYLKEGEVNNKFWLSLILTLLFWLPGVIYAFLVIFDEV